MIALEHVHARYHDHATSVLEDVTLHVPHQKTLVLLGGSGAGKSTILKLIMRLMEAERGTIRVDGADIAAMDPVILRRSIGMVFQQTALFPHMTVAENIGLRLRMLGTRKRERQSRVEELLHLVGLEPALYASRYPSMLSGGQQQRVGVARAIATRPSYLLMDEPFGALDAVTRRTLQEELKLLRRKLNMTILFVTHDVMEAASLGDAIAVMDQGRMIQTGSVAELMHDPAQPIVRDLVSTPLLELESFVRESVR